jgi:DNA polymerase-3 subunit alpha
MQLEGLPRNSSTHAAGVVIGDRPLAQLVPLYRDPRSDMPVTQFDMKHVEDLGLVKFDFLGLKTLSVLRKAVDLLGKRGIAIDLSRAAVGRCRSVPAAPVGRYGGRVPAGIGRDAAHAGGGEADQFRRHHRARLALPARPDGQHPAVRAAQERAGEHRIPAQLAGILSETYGIFVYQEQVMQAAQILAGYSLGDADLLRRAMGKKVQAEMDAQRQRFVDGCKEVSASRPPRPTSCST